jgi:hypothetical protein
MSDWPDHISEFERRVLTTTEDERMQVILVELVKQVMALNASLDQIGAGIHRIADSLA